jgi:hypothetical protein
MSFSCCLMFFNLELHMSCRLNRRINYCFPVCLFFFCYPLVFAMAYGLHCSENSRSNSNVFVGVVSGTH